MIGKILKERYKIYDKVGSGGVASVFIARDLQTYEVVAVKILKEEYTSNPNFIKRFLREAEVVSNLHHQNITNVKDYGVEDNQYFIVMEYVEGKMLSQIVEEKGCIPPDQTIDVIIQVLSALEYAWENGIVAHRDIKPQNIMLDKTGLIKVMDFGIARVSSSHTMTQAGTFLGTPYYMSPEQAQGRETDIRSDIYSVGISLFQLVCGKVPFDADTPWSVVNMHITQTPPCIQINPPYHDLCKVIDKSLAKKVEERYQTPKEMQADLELIKKGSSLTPESGATMVMTAAGELYVNSNPPGARVYINQELKGVSPTLVRNLPPKSYKVKIEKENFKTEEKSCQVVANQRAMLELTLKPSTAKQQSTTYQQPIQANGNQTFVGEAPTTYPPQTMQQPAARKSPIALIGIIGFVVVAMVVGGILVFKPKGTVNKNSTDYSQYQNNTGNNQNSGNNQGSTGGSTNSGTTTVGATQLLIESEPAGAEIYLDGTSISQITPFTIQSIQPGKHDISVIYNHQKATQSITLGSGEQKQIKLIIPISTENEIIASSIPSGAEIFLDGKDTGQKTPATLSKLVKGIHEVRFVLPGYEAFEIQVNVNGTAIVSGNLVRSGTPQGTVIFQSNPGNATVTIQGKAYGTTPVTITLAPGTYSAVVSLAGYKNETKSFEIKADEQITVSVTLTKIPPPPPPPPTSKTGTVSISSSPSGANVYIGGKYYGSTPMTITLSAGYYTATVKLSGYYDASKSFSVSQGQQTSLTIYLTKIPPKPPEPSTGNLTITSSPSGAEVYVNGSFKGMTPLTLTGINKGAYTIKVVLEGYESASRSVTVYGGQTSRADFQLKKKLSGPAILKIFSNPEGAEVYIDGNLVGLTNDTFTISAGTHKILIRLEGYKDFVMTITVKSGETREIRATLIEK